LLLDHNYSGFGDFTNLMRIGRFLQSKGYNVYSTIVTMEHRSKVVVESKLVPAVLNITSEDKTIPSITHPGDIDQIIMVLKEKLKNPDPTSNKVLIDLQGVHYFGRNRRRSKHVSMSRNIFKTIVLHLHDRIKPNMDFNKIIPQLIDDLKQQQKVKIDFELGVFGSKEKRSDISRIIINQYSGSEGDQKLDQSHADYIIDPIPSKNSEQMGASFYTHNNYYKIQKKTLVESLIKFPGLALQKQHLLNSKWGVYYSGTLGTNGLFFKLLAKTTPKMVKEHKQITYFTFLDNHHFSKYVLPYIKDFGIINLNSKGKKVINPSKGKSVRIINLTVPSKVVEAIANCSEVCSVCAGDGSFNILYNRLRESHNFSFFKYYNFNQGYFFQFLVNKIHEFEEKNNLNHDISRTFFAFGFYEKIFQYHKKQREPFKMKSLDQFEMFEHTKEEFHILEYFNNKRKDFKLMEKMFYDKETIKQFNFIMCNLIEFVKTEDNLLPVEDVLLDIIENSD